VPKKLPKIYNPERKRLYEYITLRNGVYYTLIAGVFIPLISACNAGETPTVIPTRVPTPTRVPGQPTSTSTFAGQPFTPERQKTHLQNTIISTEAECAGLFATVYWKETTTAYAKGEYELVIQLPKNASRTIVLERDYSDAGFGYSFEHIVPEGEDMVDSSDLENPDQFTIVSGSGDPRTLQPDRVFVSLDGSEECTIEFEWVFPPAEK